MTTPEEQLTALVKDALSGQSGEFRPFAAFDEQLDCIRVVLRDCSVCETRVNKLLTILEDNYPEPGESKYIGFTIKGVAHICETYGMSANIPWEFAELLDMALKGEG